MGHPQAGARCPPGRSSVSGREKAKGEGVRDDYRGHSSNENPHRNPHRRGRLPRPQRRHSGRRHRRGQGTDGQPSGFSAASRACSIRCARGCSIPTRWTDSCSSGGRSSGQATRGGSPPRSATARPGRSTRHHSGSQGNFERLGLRALVVVGGDGSLSIAQQLHAEGYPWWASPRRSTTTSPARP